MLEIIQFTLNIYAFSFVIGLLLSFFLVASKSSIIFLLFMKKQVALGTTVIVLSEAIIGLTLFLFIRKYEINSEYLMFGFITGLGISLLLLVSFFLIRNSKKGNQ